MPDPQQTPFTTDVSTEPHRFAVSTVRRLRDAGYQALWAGGCVRDLIRGVTPKDYDVATDATPDAVREVFGARRTYAVGESFGVIIVRGSKQSGDIEVATFRTEGPYIDGRRPESVVFCSPAEDASRRDFTINGMFYDPLDEVVHDYVGGHADLNAGVVRAIGRPADRMSEDKLRLLRAVRFAAVMNFELEAETFDAVRSMAAEIHVVSPERIAEELRKMLTSGAAARAVRLLARTRLLPEVLPEVEPPTDIASDPRLQTLHALDSHTFPIGLAVLLGDQLSEVDPLADRLRLANDERERAAWLIGNRPRVSRLSDSRDHERKPFFAHRHFPELQTLVGAEAVAGVRAHADVDFIRHYLETHDRNALDPKPLIKGGRLIELGFTPGPEFKTALQAIRDAQLDGEITTAAEAEEKARELLG